MAEPLSRPDGVSWKWVFVIGPYNGGEFSTGMGSGENVARLPKGYSGGVLANEIETVAAWLRARK